MRLKQEITSILSHYKASSEETRKIAKQLTTGEDGSDEGTIRGGGIPIKNLILSIELAIQSSGKG